MADIIEFPSKSITVKEALTVLVCPCGNDEYVATSESLICIDCGDPIDWETAKSILDEIEF